MGSPLSFPILCIINAAVNRLFYELSESSYSQETFKIKGCNCKIVSRYERKSKCPYHHRFRLDQVPMLINGDDVLLRMKGKYYASWKEFVNEAGLVPSIGKNYLSKAYVIINSTLFEYGTSDCTLSPNFQKRPYFNMGLVHPQWNERSSLGGDQLSLEPEVADLGTVSYDMCKGFDYSLQDRMMSIFIGDPVVKGLLKSVPSGVSYFVSKTLGGCGLKSTRDGLLTSEQRGYYTRVATTRGELAPLVKDPKMILDKLQNIYDSVEGDVVSEDWNLDSSYPGPCNGLLLQTYFLENCVDLCFDNFKKDQLATHKPAFLNGDPVKRTKYLEIPSPISTGLFRAHPCPYPEHLLFQFPWRRQQLVVYPAVENVDFNWFRDVGLEVYPQVRNTMEPVEDDLGSYLKSVEVEYDNDRVLLDRLHNLKLFSNTIDNSVMVAS